MKIMPESIRKVENFKVPIYYHDIIRKAKKNSINLNEIFGEKEIEENLKLFVSNLITKVRLSLIYSNLTFNEVINFIKDMETGFEKNRKPIATTIGAITAGEAIENYINGITGAEKDLSLISLYVYLKTAIDNVFDILMQEAKDQGCELSPFYFIYYPFKFDESISVMENLLTAEFLDKMHSGKIGVRLNGNKLNPEFSIVFFSHWFVKRKK